MINLKNIYKKYGDNTVLENFSLNLKKGEAVGLLGESGAGKSTILGLISGLVLPDSGEVQINSSRIGYIFQDHRLIPWRTALDNVCFALKAQGISKRNAVPIARDLLKKVELSEWEDHYPAQLSGGMCQRVSIARAFVVKPDILLMDEPFSALDPGLTERMNDLVSRLRHDFGSAMIYVTHNEEDLTGRIDRKPHLLRGGGLKTN